MTTPMTTNWKKLVTSEGELVDPTKYRQLIESLMYLVNTRRDMSYAVNTLSQYMVEPRRAHWVVAKHVLKYLKGMIDYGLNYEKRDGIELTGQEVPWTGKALYDVVSAWVR